MRGSPQGDHLFHFTDWRRVCPEGEKGGEAETYSHYLDLCRGRELGNKRTESRRRRLLSKTLRDESADRYDRESKFCGRLDGRQAEQLCGAEAKQGLCSNWSIVI